MANLVAWRVDNRKAVKDLNAWLNSLGTTGLGRCAAYLAVLAQEDSKRSFVEKHGPEGEAWPPAKGAKRPGIRGGKTHGLLWLTGALFRSVVALWRRSAAGHGVVEVGSVGPAQRYASIHQFGSEHQGDKGSIPARVYAGLTPQSIEIGKTFISEHLLGGGE